MMGTQTSMARMRTTVRMRARMVSDMGVLQDAHRQRWICETQVARFAEIAIGPKGRGEKIDLFED
jgi:hypothetical protein